MKLVNDTPQIDNNKHITPPKLKIMSDLDAEMKFILSSENDEYTKAKLYSEALRKYLIYKQLNEEELQYDTTHTNKLISDIAQNFKSIPQFLKVSTKGKIKKKHKVSTLKKKGKNKTKIISSNKKPGVIKQDSEQDIDWFDAHNQPILTELNWENFTL